MAEDYLSAEQMARFSSKRYRVRDAHKDTSSTATDTQNPQNTHNPAPTMRLLTPQRFFAAAVIVVLAVLMIYCQMQLTVLNGQINSMQSDIQTLESEYITLESRREQVLSADNIEAYAADVLGMVKMDYTSVEYIELSNPDQIELAAQGTEVIDLFNDLLVILGIQEET